MGFKIISYGKYLPEKIFSDTLDTLYDYKKGTHFKFSGVQKRYYAYENENPSDLATKAIQEALKKKNFVIEDIDCLISASATQEQALPYNAAIVLSKFKSNKPIATFDVNMTCLSFLQALSIANMYFNTNVYKRILIYSSETPSLSLNRKDPKISGLFGDGSVAFIFEQSSEKNNANYARIETYAEGAKYCQVESGGYKEHPFKKNSSYKEKAFFEMDGKKLFKLAGKHLPSFVDKYFQQNNICKEQIDLFIPHQASHLGLLHIQKKLKIKDDKFLNILNDYGNQVAASIPMGLYYALENNMIKDKDKIVLLGTSAGVSLGIYYIEV